MTRFQMPVVMTSAIPEPRSGDDIGHTRTQVEQADFEIIPNREVGRG